MKDFLHHIIRSPKKVLKLIKYMSITKTLEILHIGNDISNSGKK